MTGSGVE